jgi:thiamine biosynthesis lipoprotein
MSSITLRDQAVSTSGVYRQYFEREGGRYAHLLDARTGKPIPHDLLSVSVVNDSAFAADGWDTALLILGPVEGRALAEKLKLDAMFLRE